MDITSMDSHILFMEIMNLFSIHIILANLFLQKIMIILWNVAIRVISY